MLQIQIVNRIKQVILQKAESVTKHKRDSAKLAAGAHANI